MITNKTWCSRVY